MAVAVLVTDPASTSAAVVRKVAVQVWDAPVARVAAGRQAMWKGRAGPWSLTSLRSRATLP